MEVVVDALEPTVSFDTVGHSVHNVSKENFAGPDTHRGRLVPLRYESPAFWRGSLFMTVLYVASTTRNHRFRVFGMAPPDVLECAELPSSQGRW
jgi:hypothetical protein